MSTQALECPKCKGKGEYRQFAAPEDRAMQHIYAVGWECVKCKERMVEACPLGPLAPKEALCINCGMELESPDAACKGCTLTREKAIEFLGVKEPVTDVLATAAKDFNEGLFRRGLARLNVALEKDYSLHPAWMLKRQFMQALGFHQAIIKMLEGALAGGAPKELLVDLGIAQHSVQQNEEAVKAYQRYIAEAPGGPLQGPAYGNQGNALSQLGRLPEAEACYKKALELEPHRAVNYLNYGIFLREAKRVPEALAVLDSCIALADEDSQFRPERDPFLRHVHTDRSFLLCELDRGKEALEAIDQALADDPKDLKARYFRARALSMLGRLPEAKATLEGVVRDEPKFEDALRALVMVNDALKKGPLPPPAAPDIPAKN